MSEHRKQRVTVGEMLDEQLAVRAMEIPSIVDPRRVIDESDRQMVDCRDWDSDRHAVSDARLSDEELLADERDAARTGGRDLTERATPQGPAAERDEPRRKSDDVTAHLFATFHAGIGDHHFDTIAGKDDRYLAEPADPHLTETLDHDLDGPGIEDGDLGGES